MMTSRRSPISVTGPGAVTTTLHFLRYL
jgi:hypothetical protein